MLLWMHFSQAAINVGALGKLAALMQHPKKHVRKETCWTLSNVTAGNRSQIQAVCDAGLVPLLLGQMDNAEFEVQREACWTISNIASGGSDEQIAFLVENDCLPRLSKMFLVKDLKTVLVSLEGLDKLLNAGKRRMENEGLMRNPYAVLVEECGGIEVIDKLQKHKNENVFNLVSDIIDKYFPEDEDDGDDGDDGDGSFFGVDKMNPIDGYQL
jgi:importin subunit alpha-6/7